MSELGLFPLPLVLLPTEQVPLHIFEERYKDLITECLDDEGSSGSCTRTRREFARSERARWW